MRPPSPIRVFRPLGLTLAIITGAILFGFFPLLKAYIAWRWNRGFEEDGAILGATIPYDNFTLLTGTLGCLVLLSACFAWWGKPPQIRFVYQGAVLITSFSLIAETITRMQTAYNPATAIYPLEDTIQQALQCQVPFQILLTLYIIWYCNRAPARAFYQQKPLTKWQAAD